MNPHDLEKWANLIRSIAAPVATKSPVPDQGAIVGPFLRAAGFPDHRNATPDPRESPDIALWRAITDPDINVDNIINSAPDSPNKTGPLFTQGERQALEVWTECDLCGLHALHNLAARDNNDDWHDRVRNVRDWHLEYTQPDNATNRPWAIHVFILGQTPETNFYAETLLHNALAARREPEPLSAHILMNAVAELEIELT